MTDGYVHGYGTREASRLYDQAATLEALLHSDTVYTPGSRVLEAGCGNGAQTVVLGRNSPEASFVSIDISSTSLVEAQARATAAGLTHFEFRQADILALPFEPETFDHVFVCFVLEHLPQAEQALAALKRVLRPGGTITVIEGDHGSAYFHPDSEPARKAIQCQVDLQRASGGDANIGRRVYPLLMEAGYDDVRVSPRQVYADGSRPDLIEGFTRRTFTAMVEGVRETAISSGLLSPETFDAGIKALYRTAEPDGVFCYTFFKGTACKAEA
jgi:SAM-dependent methyltransferase